jgi:hypothetical protein
VVAAVTSWWSARASRWGSPRWWPWGRWALASRPRWRGGQVAAGGDVELRAARPLPAEAETALEHLDAGTRMVRVRELVAMVRGQPAATACWSS